MAVQLAVPLTQEQVEFACQAHEQLPQWRLSESALEQLSKKLTGFSSEACLLKTVAVNEIYGTNVIATVRMAKRIETTNADGGLATAGLEIVETIARLPTKPGQKQRLYISFASKFCHFFVNADKFPIYDDAARKAIALHLGSGRCEADNAKPYQAFCRNFYRLKSEAELKCTTKELDCYLWLLGMYLRYWNQRLKKKQLVNAELLQQFKKPTQEFETPFQAMLPLHLAETFNTKH